MEENNNLNNVVPQAAPASTPESQATAPQTDQSPTAQPAEPEWDLAVDENNELKLTFPNAVHYLQKKHWEWANNPTERDKASFFPENFELIHKAKQLKLVEGDYKFDDYIQFHVINGHTPYQQIVSVKDDNDTNYCKNKKISDIL